MKPFGEGMFLSLEDTKRFGALAAVDQQALVKAIIQGRQFIKARYQKRKSYGRRKPT